MRVLSLLVSALAAAACFNSNGTMNETLPIVVKNNFAVVEYEPLVVFAPPTTAPTTSVPPSSSSSPTTSAPPSSSSSPTTSAPPSSSSSGNSGSTSSSSGNSSSTSTGGSSSSSASEAQDLPRLYKLRSSHRRL